MPTVFRIVKTKYATNGFDGSGAKKFGGRWNSKGVGLIYTSDTLSLAILEMLVHLHQDALLTNYTVCALEVPDEMVLTLPDDALPHRWQADPPPDATAALGDEWVASGSSLVLSVPSAIVPIQRNLLLNPEHPDFQQVKRLIRCEAFRFDSRLSRIKS